jgi:protein-tyrosine-phosphatase
MPVLDMKGLQIVASLNGQHIKPSKTGFRPSKTQSNTPHAVSQRARPWTPLTKFGKDHGTKEDVVSGNISRKMSRFPPSTAPDSEAHPPHARPQDEPLWQGAGLSTGFPLPTGYAEGSATPPAPSRSRGEYDFFATGQRLRALKEHRAAAAAAATDRSSQRGPSPSTIHPPLRPYYRASPLLAEFQRQRDRSTTARVLIVDEGGEFRAILATALLRAMLSKLRTPLDIAVDWASLGPLTGDGIGDRRVMRIAAEMGLPLPAGNAARGRSFRDVDDAVRYDMIVVLDRFDYQEVMREVAALDAANRGGHYAGRVRLLGPFGHALQRREAPRSGVVEDIADPLYGMHAGIEAEEHALRTAAKDIAFACRGLVTYLVMLRGRCRGGMPLRDALVMSLRCPLLLGEIPARPGAPMVHPKDDAFTVRAVGGRRQVVRLPSRPRGYWRDPQNVLNELQEWMKDRTSDRLPSQQELRRAGASSLASAVDAHGGLAVFADLMGVELAARRPNGHWASFESLAREILPYLNRSAHNDSQEEYNNNRGGGSNGTGSASTATTTSPMPTAYLPTQRQLLAAGRGDLLRAIRQHGGSSVVAERLGVSVRRGSGWTVNEVWQELAEFAGGDEAESGLCLVGLPTRQELTQEGRKDLVAVVDRLGGFPFFRQHLQEVCSREGPASVETNAGGANAVDGNAEVSVKGRKRGQEDKPRVAVKAKRGLPTLERVAADIERWMASRAEEELRFPVSRVPSRKELQAAGREDLWIAAQRCGGMRRIAEHLGLGWVETRGRRRQGAAQAVLVGTPLGAETAAGKAGQGNVDVREELHILEAYEEFTLV